MLPCGEPRPGFLAMACGTYPTDVQPGTKMFVVAPPVARGALVANEWWRRMAWRRADVIRCNQVEFVAAIEIEISLLR